VGVLTFTAHRSLSRGLQADLHGGQQQEAFEGYSLGVSMGQTQNKISFDQFVVFADGNTPTQLNTA